LVGANQKTWFRLVKAVVTDRCWAAVNITHQMSCPLVLDNAAAGWLSIHRHFIFLRVAREVASHWNSRRWDE
jgi:hypothetical protein